MKKKQLTRSIKERAYSLGFSAVGIAPVSTVAGDYFQLWLDRQYQGTMSYMNRSAKKRKDPAKVLSGARSIISVSLNYFYDFKLPYDSPQKGVVSRYASGDDYHKVLGKKLERLLEHIKELDPETQGKTYVDTGPVMDKYWAAQSGIGWLGKHTNLLSREAGSWFFLGEILLSIDLEYDLPGEDFCGTCTRCIDACPTDAIVEPYVLDSRRCISYLTIEQREDISEEFREPMANLIFGCDICQDVCPWNQSIPESTVGEFKIRENNRSPDLRELAQLTPDEFRDHYRNSPIKRTKWRGLLRNVAVAMGNSRDPEMVPYLEQLLNCGEPLISRHAAWALERINTPKAKEVIRKYSQK